MKKLFSILISLIMIVSAVSCSKSVPPADGTPDPGAEASAALSPTEAPTAEVQATAVPESGPVIRSCQVSYSAEQLVEYCDYALVGRITGTHYEVHNISTGELTEPGDTDVYANGLYTMYDVEVLKVFKGSFGETMCFKLYGADSEKDREAQAAAWGLEPYMLPVYIGQWPEIEIGSCYLLIMTESMTDIPFAGRWQRIFPFDPSDPDLVVDDLCVKEVVMQFGENAWDEYSAIRP